MSDTVEMYISSVKDAFFCSGVQECHFLTDFENSVNDFVSCHPYTYNSLVNKFGSPDEVYAKYHTSLSPEQCVTVAKKHKYTSILLALTVTLCVVVLSCVISYVSSLEKERRLKTIIPPRASYVTSQITVIRSR